MRTIAFLTCTRFPDVTADDAPAVRLLESRGYSVKLVVWDEPVDLAPFDLVVMRSCWDSHEKPRQFLRFLDEAARCGAPLVNGPRICANNVAKTYLRGMAAFGVEAARTIWIEPGDERSLDVVLRSNSFDDAVVKPVVSMSGIDTWRTSTAESGVQEGEWRRLVATRAMMVQEYMPAIEEGELSLVFFDRVFSHAVRKTPRAGEFRVQEEYGGTRRSIWPSQEVISQAARVLESIDGPLTFARVNGVMDRGRFVLMELEAIDPTLFLAYDGGAAARFVDALERARASRLRMH